MNACAFCVGEEGARARGQSHVKRLMRCVVRARAPTNAVNGQMCVAPLKRRAICMHRPSWEAPRVRGCMHRAGRVSYRMKMGARKMCGAT